MKVIVLLKMVPDTVEELAIAANGKSLDTEWLRTILSEPDDHAMEQAVLLKEKFGATVTLVTMEAPEVDEVLFNGLAKGADRAVKLVHSLEGARSPATAEMFAAYLKDNGLIGPDTLILTGAQAIDDLEGDLAATLATNLGLPYLGVVTGVTPEAGKVTVIKEFAGGLRGEFELPLPCLLGIQSAEQPPRYVPVAKVRGMMKTATIETLDVTPPATAGTYDITRMFQPEAAGRAEMLEGSPDAVAARIASILAERGLL